MSTYREIIYLVLDEMKIQSVDSYFGEEHMMYLINLYRPVILKQRYTDVRKDIPEANFQSIILELQDSPEIDGELDGANYYKRTKLKLPNIVNLDGKERMINISSPRDYWKGEISFVNKDRFKYVGYNKWLKNAVYASLNPDQYIYLKAPNTIINTLASIRVSSVFENPVEVNMLNVDIHGKIQDPMDIECPIELNLIPVIAQFILKDIEPAMDRNIDDENNARDDSPEEYNKNAKAQIALQKEQQGQQQ